MAGTVAVPWPDREVRGAARLSSVPAGRRPLLLALTAAFGAYTALAVLLTFPLVLNLSSTLPKDLGDPLVVTSILWWNAHVMPLTEQWWNGFGFFPAGGMMAFSEHFLGAALIASPLQWLGLSAIAAYNVTFLLSFPLSGVAAYALAFTLTRRHDAAAVCGLAYAFNPYRVAHAEHLELLLAFGMPAALAGLHLYLERRSPKWLVLFATAVALQVLSGSYYALFFTVFLGLWILWFVRPAAWRVALSIVATAGTAALVAAPIVLGYGRIHDDFNLRRDFTEEVLKFSGDISSFVTASPLSALWGWTGSLNGGERQLFPGFTIAALAVAGLVVRRRAAAEGRDRLAVISTGLWVLSSIYAAIAVWAGIAGPSRVEWGWLTISVSAAYKPTSTAVAFAIGAIALSPSVRAAWRRQSVFAFYAAAAGVLFLCSLGPRPTFLGEQVLYEPPYAWLMRLPLFGDTVRVPARFAMLGILALSVTASLAFNRLAPLARPRSVWLACAMAGILADGWIRDMPLAAVPRSSFAIPAAQRAAAVIELPFGDVWRDTAAMYRATLHGTPAVNGYNGFEPSYYQALRRALDERDPTILDALASFGPMVIAVDNRATPRGSWTSFLSASGSVQPITADADWTLFRLSPPTAPTLREDCGEPVSIGAIFANRGQVDSAGLTDQDPDTRWITEGPQRAGDALTVDLGHEQAICGVVISMGSAAVLYPDTLSVATSIDGETWQPAFAGMLGGMAFKAALANPRAGRVSVSLKGRAGRFVRLRVEGSHGAYPWAIADVEIRAPPPLSAVDAAVAD